MAFRALVTVGGVDLPTPSSYVGLTADLVDAGRNVQGVTVGAVVRSDVAKVEMSWKVLTPTQWSDIIKLFNPTYGGSFFQSVTFYNQSIADWETRTMYPSDRTSGGAYSVAPLTGVPTHWKECSLKLVEA